MTLFLSSKKLLQFSIIFIVSLAFSVIEVKSQKIEELTDAQVKELLRRAETSGMSETDLEKYVLSRGYSATDVVRLKERINQVKGGGAKVGGAKQNNDASEPRKVIEEQKSEKGIDSKIEGSIPPEVKSIPVENKNEIKVYGSSLFTQKNLTFEPNLRIPTPKNYILGTDDELNVDIYGNSQMNYKVRITPEGTVKIENLAPIFVNGLTVDQAGDRIVNRLKGLYYGLNTQGGGVYAQVTLGNIRSIKVTVIGEVFQPGSYTVPSLATIFNALYQAGGPSNNGSYRNIQLIRENRIVKTLDLYDFLLRADQSANVVLKDQDVIKVNDYDKKVYLEGQVKRPAIYELKKGENLATLLGYAGNFAEKAYTKSIKVKRSTDLEQRIIEVKKENMAGFMPEQGDKFFVSSNLNTFENRVIITGAVKRPGEYPYGTNSDINTVGDLIKSAEGITDEAFTQRANLIRQRKNNEPELISFDLSKVLIGDSDISLAKNDSVFIYKVTDVNERKFVSIFGEINKPDEYRFKENMTLADLIVEAGGFSDGASNSKIEVARRVKYDSLGVNKWQTAKVLEFSISGNLGINTNEASFVLKPFDVVAVKTASNYADQKTVQIRGEVVYPGYYVLKDSDEKLAELINRAGGIKPSAFLQGGSIFRKDRLVSVNFQKVLDDQNSLDNLNLVEGDSVVIPIKSQTIAIEGGVYNPALVAFENNNKLKDYVSKAGGYTEASIPKRSYVVYANGLSKQTKYWWFFRFYPKVEPGSRIVVPVVDPNKESKRLSAGETAALTTAFASIVGILITVVNAIK